MQFASWRREVERVVANAGRVPYWHALRSHRLLIVCHHGDRGRRRARGRRDRHEAVRRGARILGSSRGPALGHGRSACGGPCSPSSQPADGSSGLRPADRSSRLPPTSVRSSGALHRQLGARRHSASINVTPLVPGRPRRYPGERSERRRRREVANRFARLRDRERTKQFQTGCRRRSRTSGRRCARAVAE